MTIRYPNGSNYHSDYDFNYNKNYNTNSYRNTTIYGDRGMKLENEINQSNHYYLDNNIAVVHKKPTPVQIVRVNYPKRSAAVIKEAYFSKASTTDYNGVYKGYYIDFDAKETKNKTSFPLHNFHAHQVKHMKQCVKQGGICFALIKFVLTNEIYVLDANVLFDYWDAQFKGNRKSIPKLTIKKQGYMIKYQLQPLIPYLNAVDKLIAYKKEY